ncbi:heavy-metal-associated domain-containing protein [Tenacibaculum sp. TC6]|uniref:heavy-metal-associated domain-containing protein n=1 Tax=Tenacibaculum sp. TC6 TaxID=3423223 RepID=UPI003D35C2AB
MKHLILTITMVLFCATMQAQEKKKNAKTTIKVDGVCMMCKKRIEKAALATKGVKYAVWNVKTHDLDLIFDERKTAIKAIEENIAKAGHDTQETKATDEDYNNLHPCCKYRDTKVIDDHKN